jgi:hypothetical protein
MATLELPTKTGVKVLAYEVWDGQRLRSTRQCPVGFDTETEWIRDPRQVPRLALAVASDGRTHVVIHPDRLGNFLLLHRDAHVVGHNVQFDFWVVDEHLKGAGQEPARRVLWDLCDQGRLFDTQILDMLLQLATGKFRKVGAAGATRRKAKEDSKVYPGNLAEVAADYTTLRVTKDDPFRERFGELVGLDVGAWRGVDPGFFQYAVRDAFTTYRLYPALANTAYQEMVAYGFDRGAQRYDIRPDAIDKFGYLSEVIQVQASIVLARLFRRGVRVNLAKARALEEKYRAELAEAVAELERNHRHVLTYAKDGTLKLTPKGRTPSLGDKKLGDMLLRVVAEARERGHDIQVPVSNGKKKGMALGVKAWTPYAALHPFLGVWARMAKLKKLLEFLAGLTATVLHGEYRLLTRTGRTSCSRPRSAEVPGLNVQQMPKLAEFRELFEAEVDYKLFIGDFKAAELCTLAAVCRARYGFSKLGDVITGGTDPHAFTAAAILGMPLADFISLEKTDPKRFERFRQSSKALNFGIPGGLGSKALVAYARAIYGVTLTLEEAEQFRQRIIHEIYPELALYLADNSMALLARNLGVSEREAWEVFDRSGRKNPIAARGVAKVIAGTSTASAYYQASVWDGLYRLAKAARDLDTEVAARIAREEGGAVLVRQALSPERCDPDRQDPGGRGLHGRQEHPVPVVVRRRRQAGPVEATARRLRRLRFYPRRDAGAGAGRGRRGTRPSHPGHQGAGDGGGDGSRRPGGVQVGARRLLDEAVRAA